MSSAAAFIVLHGLGAAASFIGTLLISRNLDVSDVATIATLKNGAEFLAILFALGLPYSFAYIVSRRSRLVVMIPPIIVILVIFIFAAYCLLSSYFDAATGGHYSEYGLSFLAALTGLVLSACARNIELGQKAGIGYNLITICPNIIFLFIAAASGSFLTGPQAWIALAVLWLVCGTYFVVVALRRAQAFKLTSKPRAYLAFKVITPLSFASWVQQILGLLPLFFTYQVLSAAADQEAIKGLLITMAFYNVLASPISMLGPFLFRLWLERGSIQERIALILRLQMVGVMMFSTVLAVVFFAGKQVSALFNSTNDLTLELIIISLAAWGTHAMRVCAPLLQAERQARMLAIALASRMVPIIMGALAIMIGDYGASPLLKMCVAWVVAEFSAALILVRWLHHEVRTGT